MKAEVFFLGLHNTAGTNKRRTVLILTTQKGDMRNTTKAGNRNMPQDFTRKALRPTQNIRKLHFRKDLSHSWV